MKTAFQYAQELEGLRGLPRGRPALKPYKDSKGVWTNGYGNTRGVTASTPPITQAIADADLRAHLAEADRYIRLHATVPLNEYQRTALQLFILNAGVGAFVSSKLLRELNKGNYDAVPQQLRRWVHITVDGKPVKLDGLVNRREAEIEIWNAAPQPGTPLSLFEGPEDVEGAPPQPATPPQPDNVLQTSTGRAMGGATVAGVTAAATQASTVMQQVQNLGFDLKSVLLIVGVIGALACIGFTVWTLWDRARKLKETGQ